MPNDNAHKRDSDDEDQRIEYGDIVRVAESGDMYPVVGMEQGGRTPEVPSGAGATTRQFFRSELELVEKDGSLYGAYRLGLKNAPVDDEIAEVVATLALEGHIKQSALPVLFSVVGEEVAIKVADRME